MGTGSIVDLMFTLLWLAEDPEVTAGFESRVRSASSLLPFLAKQLERAARSIESESDSPEIERVRLAAWCRLDTSGFGKKIGGVSFVCLDGVWRFSGLSF